MVSNTPGLAGTVIDDVNHYIWFEKRLQQIIDNFVVLKKCSKAFGGGRIGHFYEVD
jgi:hypothetical protein